MNSAGNTTGKHTTTIDNTNTNNITWTIANTNGTQSKLIMGIINEAVRCRVLWMKHSQWQRVIQASRNEYIHLTRTAAVLPGTVF